MALSSNGEVIAIVGAGVAGLTAAWLLDGRHDLILIDQEKLAGGHAQTMTHEIDGKAISVDLAFQHFSQGMFPRFSRLLEELGVSTYRSNVSATFSGIAYRRSLQLTPTLAPRSILRALEPSVLASLLRLQRTFSAAEWLEREGDWDTTLEDFVAANRLHHGFSSGLLLPLLASILGTSLKTTGKISARAAFEFPLNHRPSHPFANYEFCEISGGVASYVKAIRGALRTTRLVLGKRISRVSRRDAGFLLEDDNGERIECDRLVLATPPPSTARIIEGLPEWEAIRGMLADLSYPETKIALHSDRSLMPRDRELWSGFHCDHDGESSETTLWVGQRMGVDLFKSWVTHRKRMPQHLHGLYLFRHPLMTPEYFRVQREVSRVQGTLGLWLAGSYTQNVDCHESGVSSAIAAASALDPDNPRVERLLG